MFTLVFWRDAIERAIKTAAQTATALIGTGMVGILDVDWVQVGSVTLVAAALSVLTSIGSGPVADPGTASLVRRGRYAAD
ncbi:holin [Leucobacter chironomi]|uniref:holin n=1 Tax=Leucobacter chironomi TaxID=491918 RepID=UPI00041B2A21|nr:holin [Leucobacter chironomi]